MSSFRLVFRQNGDNKTFSFDSDTVTIGRSNSSDLTLDHPTVSRQHAVIEHRDGRYVLIVMSKNGLTAVNRTPVEGEVTLPDNSVINFGKIGLEFQGDVQTRGKTDDGGSASFSPEEEDLEPDQSDSDASEGGDGESEDRMMESWDEIVESEEAIEAQKKRDEGEQSKDPRDKQRRGKKEQSSPIIWVAVVAILVGLGYLMTMGGGGGGNKAKTSKDVPLKEQSPVSIESNCLDKSTCIQKAKEAYKLGLQRIKEKDVRVGRLFGGYKKLLQAKKYLENGGLKTPPKEDFPKLVPELEKARKELNNKFKSFRVDFFHHKKQDNYTGMARVLNSITNHFPDPTAREHKWAKEKIKKMRTSGNYPANF